MSDCNNDCSSCKESCKDRDTKTNKPNAYSHIKKVYAVMSGKGGVGKSLVTAMLAVMAKRRGLNVGILDADVTGPSIPKLFKLTKKAVGTEEGIMPVITKTGIEVMSVNLLLENDTDPVVWRGPVIAGAVKQFWTDVMWNELDVMFIDCPPGTGDVPLTVFQSIPIDGIVVVTSPQELVAMVVEKAVKMAELMKIPVVGLVENMSYFLCDKCGAKHYIYGKGSIRETAKRYNIKQFAEMPFNKDIADCCDKGLIELFEEGYLEEFFDKTIKL